MSTEQIRNILDTLQQLDEANGPSNPSRRAFLKKAAAAAAVAAMPKSAVKAAASLQDTTPKILNFLTQEEEGAFLSIPVNRKLGGIVVRSINMFVGTVNDDPDEDEYSFSDGYLTADFEKPVEDDDSWPYGDKDQRFLTDMKAFLKEKKVLPDSVIDEIDFNESGEQDNEYASFDAGEVAHYVRDTLDVETGPTDELEVDIVPDAVKQATNIAGSVARSQAAASAGSGLAGFKDLVKRVLRLSQPTQPTSIAKPATAALPAPDKDAAELMSQLRDIVGHNLSDQEKEVVRQEIKKTDTDING